MRTSASYRRATVGSRVRLWLRLVAELVVTGLVPLGAYWADTSRQAGKLLGPRTGVVLYGAIAAEAVLGLLVLASVFRTLGELHGRRPWRRGESRGVRVLDNGARTTLTDVAYRLGIPGAVGELWQYNAGRRLRHGFFAPVLRSVTQTIPPGTQIAVPEHLFQERDRILAEIEKRAREYAGYGAGHEDEPTDDQWASDAALVDATGAASVLADELPELESGRLISPLARPGLGTRKPLPVLPAATVLERLRHAEQQGKALAERLGWQQPELPAAEDPMADLPIQADLDLSDRSLVKRCTEPASQCLAQDLAGLVAAGVLHSPNDVLLASVGGAWAVVILAPDRHVVLDKDELRPYGFMRIEDTDRTNDVKRMESVRPLIEAARRYQKRVPATKVLLYDPLSKARPKKRVVHGPECVPTLVPVGWHQDREHTAIMVNLNVASLTFSGDAAWPSVQATAAVLRERTSPFSRKTTPLGRLIQVQIPSGPNESDVIVRTVGVGVPTKDEVWHVDAKAMLWPLELQLVTAQAQIGVYVLGPLKVMDGGTVLNKDTLGVRMLALLAIHGGSMPTKEIAERLNTSPGTLRTAASQLKREFHKAITTAPDGRGAIRSLENYISDYDAFRERLARGELLTGLFLVRGTPDESLFETHQLDALRKQVWQNVNTAYYERRFQDNPDLLAFITTRALLLDPTHFDGWRNLYRLYVLQQWNIGEIEQLREYITTHSTTHSELPTLAELEAAAAKHG